MKDQYMVIFVICLIFAIMICLRKAMFKPSDSDKFDEMQLRLRGDGYRLAFMLTLAVLMLYIFISDGLGYEFVSGGFAAFFALMTGLTAFASFCIFKGAFFKLSGKPRGYIVLCAVIVVIDLTGGIINIATGKLWENGVITFGQGAPLVCGLAFLVILICIAVQQLRSRNEEEQ